MTGQLPALLPGMVPLPALPVPAPASAPTPQDPFLALLTQLVGAPTPVGQPAAEQDVPVQTETEPEEGDVEAGDPPVLPVLPQLAALAALVVAPPVPPVSPVPPVLPAPKAPDTAPAVEVVADQPRAADAPAPAPVAPQQATTPGAVPTPTATPVAPVAPVAPVTVQREMPAPAPVAHQVFPEVVRVAVTGETPTRVVVRLEPEHLGEVRVVLRTGRAGLEVSLAAGTDARAALREGAPELRRMLEAAGSPDARILVRHLADQPSPTTPATATAPVAAPTPVRTDAPVHGVAVDVGAGTAGGPSHGDRRDRPQQDAPPMATDGLPDRHLEPARQVRRASGLDVMM